MKHFLLKFNHGVEIGARAAYMGHYKRTKESKILSIATDELQHRASLHFMLQHYGEVSNPYIDGFFKFVGKFIGSACKYCPLWSLNLIARTMELFAIFNYNKLAEIYPHWKSRFEKMEASERDHEEYFRLGKHRYEMLTSLRINLEQLKWQYKSAPKED